MMQQAPAMDRYIDIRPANSPEKISLDISRHLQFRVSVGKVAIISDRPHVLLSVVRKRWTKIVQEVEKELSSTLDRAKKESLKAQVEQLRMVSFALADLNPLATVVFADRYYLFEEKNRFRTIYAVDNISHTDFLHLLNLLLPGGVFVGYTAPWDN